MLILLILLLILADTSVCGDKCTRGWPVRCVVIDVMCIESKNVKISVRWLVEEL